MHSSFVPLGLRVTDDLLAGRGEHLAGPCVSCADVSRGLGLAGNNLSPQSFPSFLVNLTSLQALDLSNSHLNGSLPDSISQLTGLTYVRVAGPVDSSKTVQHTACGA